MQHRNYMHRTVNKVAVNYKFTRKLLSEVLLRGGKIILALTILAPVGNTMANTNTRENPEHIKAVVKKFIHQQLDQKYEIQVKVGYLDKRVRLAKCEKPLQAYFPTQTHRLGATHIAVQCKKGIAKQKGWKIHLPIEIKAYAKVYTAAKPLVKGTVIQRGDLQLNRREISRYRRGVYQNIDDIEGMVVRRTIRQDAVITPGLLKPKWLVLKGEPVTILAETDGLMIRVQGEALMNGKYGQSIEVKNNRSGKTLTADVISTSTVRVKM
jgi:flagella basal body P-ring formation protein FlgA